MLRELARVLDLDSDRLLAAAGGAATVVEESLKAHPQQREAVIQLFRMAQDEGFEARERLLTRVKGEEGRRRNTDHSFLERITRTARTARMLG